MSTKKLPYGICNFANIIERNYAYVDKTRYIEILENEHTVYHYLLRPRRFGKTLFLSVLENYYDINQKNRFEALFGDTYIGKHPTPDRGKFAVLKFDFSGIEADNRDVFRSSFLGQVQKGVVKFFEKYKGVFPGAVEEARKLYNRSPELDMLSTAFHAADMAGIPVFILVDEYDHFVNKLIAMGEAYKDEVGMTGVVRTFYAILKQGTYDVVNRIFITGVSPMMVNDLTSGFNMATNLSLAPRYNEMFGFTSDEVEWLIKETGVDKSLINVDMERYYNGYMFSYEGKDKVYNSQMVLFLLDQILTSGKQPELIVDPNLKTSYERLQQLAATERNRKKLLDIAKDGETSGYPHNAFSIEELVREDYFVSFLFYLGMLTCVRDNGTTLKIPNYSIQTLYWEYVVEYISRGLGEAAIDTFKFTEVLEDLAVRGEVKPYIDFFAENFVKRLSNRDLIDFDEKYVKVMMLSSLFFNNLYHPVSEAENTEGYSDIYLQKRRAAPYVRYEYVFEVKYVKKKNASKAEIERQFAEAMGQIEKYKNDARFAGRDDVKFVSLVFIGKGGCEMRVVE